MSGEPKAGGGGGGVDVSNEQSLRILSLKSSSEDYSPAIPQVGTFDSSFADDDVSMSNKSSCTDNHSDGDELSLAIQGEVNPEGDQSPHEKNTSKWGLILHQLFYISTFGILGTVLRLYIGRFFGLDCEQQDNIYEGVDDFLMPVSSQICVTNSGKTATGGAIFTDLPANMLGSFFMGIMSPAGEGRPLPWLHEEHPLQQHTPFHIGLKVGFCGCLTTFASWNTQMVIMLDGSDTELGSQVLTVFFGYLVGVATSIASFLFGRIIFKCPPRRTRRPVLEDDASEDEDSNTALSGENTVAREDQVVTSPRDKGGIVLEWSHVVQLFAVKYGSFLLSAGLVVAFVVVDALEDSPFYRKMWMSSLLTPFGAVLRWKLSGYSTNGVRLPCFLWLPLGTFIANIMAVMISAAADALDASVIDRDAASYEWVSPTLRAIEQGFAGSLSTVSTLIREMFFMESPAQASLYCFGTIVCSMLFGLAVYSPIIRSG